MTIFQTLPTRRQCLALMASAVALMSPHLQAQTAWPTKPVTLVVPYPAGGGTDTFARPFSAQFSKQSGKTLVIDNRGGAGGNLGLAWRPKQHLTATPCSWAPCIIRLHLRCTPSSTTT